MDYKRKYNYLGEAIDEVRLELQSSDYGHYENGELIIHWDKETDEVDSRGFDKTNIEENGLYTEEVELPKGTKLCRYGLVTGRTTTLAGTKYEKLGLPYKPETIEYHEYEVIADGILVRCMVTKGRAAKMFGSEGGAIQFLHKNMILRELSSGKLKEVTEWRRRKR